MSKVLNVALSSYYYKPISSPIREEKELREAIIRIFKTNRKCFGTRKLKRYLLKEKIIVSRGRIARIMKDEGLISTYTLKKHKIVSTKTNDDAIANVVNRDFNNREHLEVIVSDLTYVRVNNDWHYICLIIDLFNREIIGYAAGRTKTSDLVYKAFSDIKWPLNKIKLFHTDRGNEFKNNIIETLLTTFNINRSLSAKGNPYDNAVSEAAMKIIKTEFIYQESFKSLEELELKLFDYVNWYNNIRIHSSLNYLPPVVYRKLNCPYKFVPV